MHLSVGKIVKKNEHDKNRKRKNLRKLVGICIRALWIRLAGRRAFARIFQCFPTARARFHFRGWCARIQKKKEKKKKKKKIKNGPQTRKKFPLLQGRENMILYFFPFQRRFYRPAKNLPGAQKCTVSSSRDVQ